MGVFFLLLFLIPMPPAGEAPPPYAEESVAAPSYVAPEDNYYQMEDNSSQPSVAHMPEPEEERGAPDCGSAAGGANPNNGVVLSVAPVDEDMNKAIMYWVIAFILFVVGWVIFPTFLCLWPIALVLLIVGFRHSQVSNQRRQQANQANQTPPV